MRRSSLPRTVPLPGFPGGILTMLGLGLAAAPCSFPQERIGCKHWRTKMAVARITEIKASSKKGFDEAMKTGLSRAAKTLDKIKGAWIENQEVVTDDDGSITEYRVQLKVTFVLKD
jgi:hypothetical protein